MSNRRPATKWSLATTIIALGLALFHLVTSAAGTLTPIPHRSLHFLLSCLVVFLAKPLNRAVKVQTKPAIYDIVLLLLLTAAVVNVWLNYKEYLTYLTPLGVSGTVFAAVVLIAVLIGTYRTTGPVFPVLTVLLLLYTQLGPYVPGAFAHPGFTWSRVLSTIYQQDVGAWGFITGMSATIVAIFLIFGALLQVTGGGEAFVKLAYLLMGRRRGGPALVAVIASALFGTISGSSMANVAATGVFTIPMMKKVGYRPAFAGAVEAFASTGGLFTPPVMAATAFIMAELLGVSYLVICVLAIIPCILYYASGFFHIFAEAKRTDLRPVPEEEIPRRSEVVNWPLLAPLFIPIALLFWLLLGGWSISYAVFWSAVAAAVLRLFSARSLAGMQRTAMGIVKALEQGGRAVADIAVLLVAAQIVVTLINLTGLGVTFGSLVMAGGERHILVALALTAAIVLVLGMGMPITGAYIVGISVAGNALIWMGLDPKAVHLLVLFYAALSGITPPVCLTSFVAEAISGASFWAITKIACGRMAIIAYILPFLFIFNPDLLIIGRNPANIVVSAICALLGVALMAQGTAGYWSVGEGRKLHPLLRLLSGAGGFLLVLPFWQARAAGLGIGVLLAIAMWLAARIAARQRMETA